MSNDNFSRLLKIGQQLDHDDHARIMEMMTKCIGEEKMIFFGIAIRDNFLKQSGLPATIPSEGQVINAMAALSACLLAMYVDGSIMFKEPKEPHGP
jgi:hypothetical protein